MRVLLSDKDLLVFERSLNDERRLCAFNLGFEARDWPALEGWVMVESVGGEDPRRLAPLAGRILAPA
jgi:hypothetical protein